MSNHTLVLKKGKEKPLKNRHHWIFSGAIHSLPVCEPGSVLSVNSFEGEFLGQCYVNKTSSIVGRMIAFDKEDVSTTLKKRIQEAYNLRQQLFDQSKTNAYRLINGEGDFLPGLIVDCYANYLVLQIGTLGMEKLKPIVVDALKEIVNPSAIFEKSLMPSRKEEGLQPIQQALLGEIPDLIEVKENGLSFVVDVHHGQKTGFFLDQRGMRELVRDSADGKKVLNCFSYSGGFGIYAAAGGAILVDSVDISAGAIELCKQNMAINSLSCQAQFIEADVFEFLRRQQMEYDLVILDPPAFAKRQKDIIPACRGYKDINRIAMSRMPPKSLLLTCSCSYYIDEELFQKVIFQAAVEAKRQVRILAKHRLAEDHPVNICHPEGDYLKSFLLYLE